MNQDDILATLQGLRDEVSRKEEELALMKDMVSLAEKMTTLAAKYKLDTGPTIN